MSSTPGAGSRQTDDTELQEMPPVEGNKPSGKNPELPAGYGPTASGLGEPDPEPGAAKRDKTRGPTGNTDLPKDSTADEALWSTAKHEQSAGSAGDSAAAQPTIVETQADTNAEIPESNKRNHPPVPGKTGGTLTPETQQSSGSATLKRQSPTPQDGNEQFSKVRQGKVEHHWYNARGMERLQGSTMNTLLGLLTDEPTMMKTAGLQIFFLPKIYSEDDPSNRQPHTVLRSDVDLCEELARKLGIDEYFFTESAWKSNGFFLSQQTKNESTSCRQNDASRFLIKWLQDTNQSKPYAWLYLSFCSVWLQDSTGNNVSCILLCFDDSEKIKMHILNTFERYPWDRINAHPLAVHDVLLRVLIKQYDEALWLFRGPVRDIEKGRETFAQEIRTLRLLDNDSTSSPGVMRNYISMHELSRHIIHMSETLQVAAKTVKAIVGNSQSRAITMEDTICANNVVDGLRFSSGFLANLKLRADAFAARLSNEIQLAYDIVSVHQLQNTERLLEESKDEGKDLTTSVTALTLFFLPSTFVAGFWGMNFVTLSDDLQLLVSPDVWAFFATSFPTTLLAIAIWASIHYWGWNPSLRPFNLLQRRRLSRKVRRLSEV